MHYANSHFLEFRKIDKSLKFLDNHGLLTSKSSNLRSTFLQFAYDMHYANSNFEIAKNLIEIWNFQLIRGIVDCREFKSEVHFLLIAVCKFKFRNFEKSIKIRHFRLIMVYQLLDSLNLKSILFHIFLICIGHAVCKFKFHNFKKLI